MSAATVGGGEGDWRVSLKEGNGELLSSMQRELDEVKVKRPEHSSRASKLICRVPSSLGRQRDGVFEPKLISIGPYHNGKELLRDMEALKWRFLDDLIQRNPTHSLDKYVHAVHALEAVARDYYCSEETSQLDSAAFVKMMVLDGCFIIEFMLKTLLGEWKIRTLDDVNNHSKSLIRDDMLLLENQIPFFVLQLLFELSEVEKAEGMPLTGICMLVFARWHGINSSPAPASIQGTSRHLLHLIQYSIRPSKSSSQSQTPRPPWMVKRAMRTLFESFLAFLSLFLYTRRPPYRKRGDVIQRPTQHTRVRSATELDAAGVMFFADAYSPLLNLTFSEFNGTLEIPPLYLDSTTFVLFHNLYMFESLYPGEGNDITTYINFLGVLIDTVADVELLQDRDILRCELQERNEVAQFFNTIPAAAASGFLAQEDNNYLSHVFQGLNNYCANESNRWKASLVNNYFKNPWTVVSLIAAFIALFLTFLQTLFALLAYFLPPKP